MFTDAEQSKYADGYDEFSMTPRNSKSSPDAVNLDICGLRNVLHHFTFGFSPSNSTAFS